MEEHVVLVQEPGSKYIGHISPTSGSSLGILEAMIQFFGNHSITLDDLQVIGCDGTNKNVGNKNGIITRLETKLIVLCNGSFASCMVTSFRCDISYYISTAKHLVPGYLVVILEGF